MNLKEYFKNEFPKDLQKLNFKKSIQAMLNNPKLFKIDTYTVFFGNSNCLSR